MVRIQAQADIISDLVYHTRIITADPCRIECNKLTTMKHIIFQCGFCAEIIDENNLIRNVNRENLKKFLPCPIIISARFFFDL